MLNNAISGVDQALWDIKGRQAGMPVYQLLGGKCREAADCYGHASAAPRSPGGRQRPKGYIAQGFRHVRVQVGVPGMAGYGAGGAATDAKVKALHDAPVFEPAVYIRRALKLFEACRKELGDEVELLHDVHERVSPTQALQFCKDVEKFRLFFVEDPVSPEDIGWFRLIRQQCDDAARDGRAVQQPARVDAADRRAADRLHPRARVAGGRPHAVPQDGGARARRSA